MICSFLNMWKQFEHVLHSFSLVPPEKQMFLKYARPLLKCCCDTNLPTEMEPLLSCFRFHNLVIKRFANGEVRGGHFVFLNQVCLVTNAGQSLSGNETNRIPKSRNPTPCIIVIVPGSSAITYRTHSRHNIIVMFRIKSNTGLIIT
jgi:hypothetical protein